MNIRETFLALTQYTIPHGKEDTLRKYLPDGVQRDEFGNYFITIGKSDTLFTSHLDTCSTEYEQITHVIEGDIVKTDGTTILGGDNKTGVCILLNMIEHNIPGTYYFFAGEEPTAKDGGLYGSKKALAANPEFFKKFKRAVCFDRKYEGSIVVRQMARFTCSEEFVIDLMKQFEKQGLEFHPDQTGWWTDTAVFIDVIPEVTNLSSGTHKEHTVEEFVDLAYLEKVAEAALNIDWESLPTVRIAKRESSRTEVGVHTFRKFKNLKSDQKTFQIVDKYMDLIGFKCLNDDEFEPGLNMIFAKWHEEQRVLISVENSVISINGEKVGGVKDFEKLLGIGFAQKVDIEEFMNFLEDVSDKIESDEIDMARLKKYFDHFNTSVEEFDEYYKSKECELKDFLRYNSKSQKIILK